MINLMLDGRIRPALLVPVLLGISLAGLAQDRAMAGATSAAAPTSFIGRGSEPNWRVEVTDGAITFQAMDAEAITITPKPEAEISAGTETFVTTVGGKAFSLAIADKLCVDTMSGMHFPKTVAVELDQAKYSGCGGDPADLLMGEWQIEQIGGKAIVAESQPTIAFGEDGKVTGNGSCNRYFGPYVLTGEGLDISDIASSMMACEQPLMDQEALLFKILGETTRFDINADGALVLHGGDGQSIVASRK